MARLGGQIWPMLQTHHIVTKGWYFLLCSINFVEIVCPGEHYGLFAVRHGLIWCVGVFPPKRFDERQASTLGRISTMHLWGLRVGASTGWCYSRASRELL